MKKVYGAANITEANLVKSYLESLSIQSFTKNESLANLMGELPIGPSTEPTVWVDDENFEKATQLMTEWSSSQSNLAPWKCPVCGEMSEGQFDACWQCSSKNS